MHKHIRDVALVSVLIFSFSASSTVVQGQESNPVSQPDTAAEVSLTGSADADLNAAVALLRQGEISSAINTVRRHLPSDPRAADLLFDAGTTMLGSALATPTSNSSQRDALLDASIALFRAILAERPNLVLVRLELARAFFLRGRDSLSRRHFELVLAANPPAPVQVNINRFLAEMRARKRWTGYFGMALAPDTNIGSSSASEVVMVDFAGQLLPFILDEPGEKSGVGLSVWAGGEYQEPIAPNWRIRLGGDIFRREYEDKKFDQMGLGVHVGPRWQIDFRTEASLLLTARRNWQGSDPTSRSQGVRLESSRLFTPRVSGQFGASWSAKRHDGSSRSDGPVTDLSVGLTWGISPALQANFRVGIGKERPETESLRSTTLRTSVGANVALPRGFNVSGTLTGRWADYKGAGFAPTNVVDGSPRKDVTRSIRLSLLKRDLTFNGFSPQLSVTYERRGSNAQQADYRRTGGEISFVRQF